VRPKKDLHGETHAGDGFFREDILCARNAGKQGPDTWHDSEGQKRKSGQTAGRPGDKYHLFWGGGGNGRAGPLGFLHNLRKNVATRSRTGKGRGNRPGSILTEKEAIRHQERSREFKRRPRVSLLVAQPQAKPSRAKRKKTNPISEKMNRRGKRQDWKRGSVPPGSN